MLETYTNPTELTRSRLPGASGLAVDREFEDVLADYGLNRDDANLNELVVPSGSVLRLSDLVKPHLRQSADAADLKRWVGTSGPTLDRPYRSITGGTERGAIKRCAAGDRKLPVRQFEACTQLQACH